MNEYLLLKMSVGTVKESQVLYVIQNFRLICVIDLKKTT